MAHYSASSRSLRRSRPSSPSRSAKGSQASLAAPAAFSALPPYTTAQRADLRVRMSFARHRNEDNSEDDDDQRVTTVSDVSLPGTRRFRFHANESQDSFESVQSSRSSFRYYANQEDNLSIMVSRKQELVLPWCSDDSF
ncbi:hypothetical protein DL93DRAFT_716839 [Clavulina sp. PMI_390]|nr:hypothetical protein DL93DRAFT_716839 [Clavulina sp. PMI_390]